MTHWILSRQTKGQPSAGRTTPRPGLANKALLFVFGATAATLVALAILGWRPLMQSAVDWLDVGTTPEPCDFVMVLGGGPTTRPLVAATLVRLGLARTVLVPHMRRPQPGEEVFLPPEDQITPEVLLRRGVPADRVRIVGQECEHTEAEARALKECLDREPKATATVVTDAFHTRRARWIFRRVMGADAERLRFVSAPTDGFLPTSWWRTEEGIRAVLYEYLKVLAYVFYYGRGVWWAAGVLGLAAAIWAGCRWRRRGQGAFPAVS
jgi:uncharacterized SAM-binding protein YcdF (DUF218 family)